MKNRDLNVPPPLFSESPKSVRNRRSSLRSRDSANKNIQERIWQNKMLFEVSCEPSIWRCGRFFGQGEIDTNPPERQ